MNKTHQHKLSQETPTAKNQAYTVHMKDEKMEAKEMCKYTT